MQTQTNNTHKKAVDPYLKQKILSATPEQLTSIAFDIAISACHRNDTAKVNRVISELISTLDFEQGEVALRFFEIYRYVRQCVYRGQTDTAVELLKELRESWNKAMNIV